MREFRQRFPNYRVAITPGDTEGLLELLENGEIDLALSVRSSRGDPFVFQSLFEDELAFVFSPAHPWSSMEVPGADDLRREQFIVYAKRSLTARLVEVYFHQRGLPAPSLIELGNMKAIKEFAKIGVGIGIVAPWIACKELEDGSLMEKPLAPDQASAVRRQWGLFSLRNRELPTAEREFMSLCESLCQTHAAR